MSTVALVVNESRPKAVDLAQAAAAWLRERSHEVRVAKPHAEGDQLGGGIDLFVSLGGDGTMLRAVHLAAAGDAPVLGVNLGRLAYLAAVEPDDLAHALDRYLAGDYRLEERSMLCFSVEGGPPATHLALNEAVLEHAGAGHTVHLAVSIDGGFFHSYVADALILATPSGSTAYSFSAGGPIVSPRHTALLVTPVAPHTPFNHTLVLHPDEQVRVEVLDHRGAVLSVDGQDLGRLVRGDVLTAAVAPAPARFVVFGDRRFYPVLKAKFGLADR